MKFLLKQLHLFFPFVFPMYIVLPGCEGGLKSGEIETVNFLFSLQKQIKELEARVKKVEELEMIIDELKKVEGKKLRRQAAEAIKNQV